MGKQKKAKWKSIRIGWKRSLIITLVITLVIGGYSFADFGPKAQAAEYKKIVGFETLPSGFSSGSIPVNQQKYALLDDGSRFLLPVDRLKQSFIIPSDYKKHQYFLDSTANIIASEWITKSGDLYTKKGSKPETLVLSGVKDFMTLMTGYDNGNYDNHYALMEDETVLAWGPGGQGELAIGYKMAKNVPTEVVDPETGDPIEGVKKLLFLSSSPQSFLMVTDNSVYLIGKAFGLNSYSAAKPIKLDFFPAFTSADDFDVNFLDDIDNDRALIWWTMSSSEYAQVERRIFTISGKNYTLTDFFASENVRSKDELASKTLYEVPEGFTKDTMQRILYTNSQYSYGPHSFGYVNLKDRELKYWGSNIEQFGSPGFSGQASFVGEPRVLATNVDKVVTSDKGTIFYQRNSNVYAIGTNYGSRSGVNGGALATPVRITGPNNEIKNVKNITESRGATFAHKDDGTLIGWKDSVNYKTYPMKFLDVFSYKVNSNGTNESYGIGEDYNLYLLTYDQITRVGEGVLPSLAPKDYVDPVTKPDTPVISIASQDKFNQNVLSINFGTQSNIATKQYQINGGGWVDYSGEIVITQSGNVTVQARSADTKGNISDLGVLTLTSDPIVINAGDPRIDKITANEFKISVSASGNIKVQVKVDGAAWQDFNVANNLLLTSGDHTVEVRILNDRDQELISKTFNVTADSPAPVVIDKPVVTQKGLNNQYGLDIEIAFDAAVGEAQYSIDGGGTWNKTTGSFSVSNAAHTIQAKVVTPDNKESEVTEFVTTIVPPKIIVTNDQVSVDLGINTNNVSVYYKDSSSNQWVEYTGPVTYLPGTHNIEIEVRDRTTGTPVFTGGPYTVTVTGTIPGDGGTTPTPDPGDGTPVGQEDVEFTVNNGGLSARFEGADLSTIVIDSTNPYQSINSVSRALIDDSRGNGKGYQYSMDVTDFKSEPMQDNSTNQNNLVVSIPANALSVDVQSTKTLNGPAAELSNVGKHVFTGKAPIMLATAKAFEGMGYNEIPLNFTLSVPDRVGIVSSGSGSKFVPGETTGLMAGIYRAQVVITLSSGI